MPSELLKCITCPKKPKFSDVSHLLTHIGSKGHLAHLHRLQVRSHQDLNAAHQLALYNQWFQEHEMATLLSERMQLKENKRAAKRAANAARLASTPASGTTRRPVRIKTESVSSSSLLDQFNTPVRAPRDSSYPVIPSSPPKMVPDGAAEDAPSIEIDHDFKTSPGTPQLKGTRYPGMAMFDAAPEEQRRMRNQKKDSSVLRKLERNAALVIPRETVSSSLGNILKHRHMDDLEIDDPVEGEFMPRQPTPKRRKYTKPRAPRVKKEKGDEKPKRRPGRPRKVPVMETPRRSLRTPADEAESSSLETPAETRRKSTVAANLGRKKNSKFVVYQDSSPGFGIDGTSDIHPNSYDEPQPARQRFATPSAVWHRPDPEPYDPFKLIRDRFTAYSGMEDLGQGKENTNTFNIGVPHTHINPLFFQTGTNHVTSTVSSSTFNRLNPIAMTNSDPFRDDDTVVPMRNPLMAALEQLRTPKQESFDFNTDHFGSFATPFRQPVFAP